MRFIPTSFFNANQLKSCVVAEGSGSVSQSFDLGSTHWEFYLFSASQQTSGEGVENFVFSILTGSTSNAIIGAVGGGGAGSSDGRGGGGGGFDLRTHVILNEGDYTIQVGQGGNKIVRASTPGSPFNGGDGRDSLIILSGQDNIRGYGGKGGDLSGNGGTSGAPTNNVGDLSGGGAYETPTDDKGGPGLTLFFGEDVQFRAGGGGAAEGENNFERSEPFGGGDGDQFGDGKGGALFDDVPCFGGGGGGGQFYNTGEDEYTNNAGGAGCVFIAIPTNLCSSSLYEKKPITTDRLKYRYEIDNANTFGLKPFSQFIYDLNSGNNILHVQDDPAFTTMPTSYITNYTSSVNILSNNLQVYSNKTVGNITGINNRELLDYFSGSLPDFNVTDNFTIEWTGADNATSGTPDDILQFNISNDNNNPKIELKSFGTLKYINSLGSATTLNATYDSSTHQHDIVYDGSLLYWYVDTILQDSASLSTESDLNNPTLQIGEPFVETGNGPTSIKLNSFRVYQKELSQSEIDTNYSQSFDL